MGVLLLVGENDMLAVTWKGVVRDDTGVTEVLLVNITCA